MVYKANEIIEHYDTCYTEDYQSLGAYFEQCADDLRMYLGDQWDAVAKKKLLDQGRSAFVINRIRPNINMGTGYQRKHRLSSVVTPISYEDDLEAEQLTKIILYFTNACDGFNVISDAYEGAWITAMNMLCLYVDYSAGLEGNISIAREPYNAFIFDPNFMKRDLSDCGHIIRRKYLGVEEAVLLIPDERKFLRSEAQKGAAQDDKFVWMPFQQNPGSKNLLAVDEFWEQKTERIKVIQDASTGNEYEYNGDDSVLMLSPDLQILEKTVSYVEKHLIVNRQHITTEKNPAGLNEYPFVPVFAHFHPEAEDWTGKCQSVVRPQVDPQIESNKRRSQLVDAVETNLNSGWIAEADSVVNPASLFKTGQGNVIWKKKGLGDGALTRIDPANIPGAWFQLKDSFDADIQFSANISDELLAQEDRAQDGAWKTAMRQSAALVGLQPLVDGLRLSQKIMSKKMIKMIPSLPKSKLKRILGEEPSPKLFDQRNLRYDIEVEEGLLTASQREMFFNQIATLKQMGEPVPPGFLSKIAPLQGRTEYKKAMDEYSQSQQQAQAQQAQVQKALLESEQNLAQAQSLAEVARAKESFAKADYTEAQRVETTAKAADERADTTLKRLEALKKLEEIDEKRLERLISIMDKIDLLSEADEQEAKDDVQQVIDEQAIMNQPQGALPAQQTQEAQAPQQEQPPEQGQLQ